MNTPRAQLSPPAQDTTDSSSSQHENVKMCEQLLAEELKQLQILQQDIANLDLHQEGAIELLFPISCRCCKQIFHNQTSFFANTRPLPDTPVPSPTTDQAPTLRDVRMCACGEKISLWETAQDRRNGSYLAFLKRILYQNCLHKLRETHPQNSKQELKQLLRVFFRSG